MAAKKKAKPPTTGQFKQGHARGGRPKGSPNRTTLDVRVAMAKFAQANSKNLTLWVRQVANGNKKLERAPDPHGAADLYLRAIEYHIPKISRTEHVTRPDEPLEMRHTFEPGPLLKTYYERAAKALAASAPAAPAAPVGGDDGRGAGPEGHTRARKG